MTQKFPKRPYLTYINLVKWNISITKGKKIKRDSKSSGERNWNLKRIVDRKDFNNMKFLSKDLEKFAIDG